MAKDARHKIQELVLGSHILSRVNDRHSFKEDNELRLTPTGVVLDAVRHWIRWAIERYGDVSLTYALELVEDEITA